MVGVVEPDCEELARLHGRQQAYLIERVTVGGIVATDDEAVFDDAVTRAAVSLKPAELHESLPSFASWWAAR